MNTIIDNWQVVEQLEAMTNNGDIFSDYACLLCDNFLAQGDKTIDEIRHFIYDRLEKHLPRVLLDAQKEAFMQALLESHLTYYKNCSEDPSEPDEISRILYSQENRVYLNSYEQYLQMKG